MNLSFAKLRLGTGPFDGRFANMTKNLLLALTLGLLASGCSSDGEIFCEKMDECNFLDGVSVEECAERVDKGGTEGERADCAACVDEKSCSSIDNGSCDADCTALFNALISGT